MVLLLCGAAGCWTSGGPALPDLSRQQVQVNERSERLRRIEELMHEDLTRVEDLHREFAAGVDELIVAPFPLDLYKHVAMDCLNEPWEGEDAEKTRADELTCEPAFLERLIAALQEKAPERSEEALERLRTVDELRRLRGQLRRRLSRIGPILSAGRDLVATRRANLRQLGVSQERRRTEYSEDRWEELQEYMAEYEDQLQELQQRIASLESASPKWPETLDRSVRQMYMEISTL